ncbi:hypothetical protein FRB99_001210 [Tulasnella sp. 403]|nr:hypothetical protein FRB99_001210 [Tulasnella sp. 403]
MDAINARFQEMQPGLYGDHAPVSERIRWHSVYDTDDKSMRVKAFSEQLDMEHAGQYAVQKFMVGGKGAVVFNVNYPVPMAEGTGRFLWAPYFSLKKTGDATLEKTVYEYNPLTQFVVLFVMPSQDLMSVDIWMMEAIFGLPTTVQPHVRRKVREWDQMMEHFPR